MNTKALAAEFIGTFMLVTSIIIVARSETEGAVWSLPG